MKILFDLCGCGQYNKQKHYQMELDKLGTKNISVCPVTFRTLAQQQQVFLTNLKPINIFCKRLLGWCRGGSNNYSKSGRTPFLKISRVFKVFYNQEFPQCNKLEPPKKYNSAYNYYKMEGPITIQHLREKRQQLQALCRHKTGDAAMRSLLTRFLSQEDISPADKADAQVQHAKYLGYMGDLNESEAIIKSLHASMDESYPEKLRAKIWFQLVLEEKRSLVFHTCMSEAEKFIAAYSSKDSLYWKYLY